MHILLAEGHLIVLVDPVRICTSEVLAPARNILETLVSFRILMRLKSWRIAAGPLENTSIWS
jgi:hypothetical protein